MEYLIQAVLNHILNLHFCYCIEMTVFVGCILWTDGFDSRRTDGPTDVANILFCNTCVAALCGFSLWWKEKCGSVSRHARNRHIAHFKAKDMVFSELPPPRLIGSTPFLHCSFLSPHLPRALLILTFPPVIFPLLFSHNLSSCLL